jgi:hypothetical protein
MSKFIVLCLFFTIVCSQSNLISMSALICKEYPKLISFSYSKKGPTFTAEMDFRLKVTSDTTFCE